MVKKLGFVSNSSSSSFIVSYDKEEDLNGKVQIEVDLKEFEDWRFGRIKDKRDLDEYFLLHYEGENLKEIFKDDPNIQEKYKKMLEEIQKGKKLIICKVTNNIDFPSPILYENLGHLILNGNAKIIDEN